MTNGAGEGNKRDRDHIFVRDPGKAEKYLPHPRRVETKPYPRFPNPAQHAAILGDTLRAIEERAIQQREGLQVSVHGAQPGLYVVFESHKRFPLPLKNLEDRGKGIEIVAVREEGEVQRATVFVPDGKVKYFLMKFEAYVRDRTPKGHPKNMDLVEGIARLRAGTLRALWTDTPDLFPNANQKVWWEVWLRHGYDGKELDRLKALAEHTKIKVLDRWLNFPDRTVTMVEATPEELSSSIDILGDLAEVRKAKETAELILSLPSEEQRERMNKLLARVKPSKGNAPAVCLLDTGVNRAHPLLEQHLDPKDMYTVKPEWNKTDQPPGHGTEMGGLAAYGDLLDMLISAGPLIFVHRLESVKILPRSGVNPRDLHGAITSQAVALPEVDGPKRKRVFSLAVTTDGRDRGAPTSWSATLDALAAGRSLDYAKGGLVFLGEAEESHRLFVVSSGNGQGVTDLGLLDNEVVQDPAQAWNAITVGGCTSMTNVDTTKGPWAGKKLIAESGQLSPHTTTSVAFDRRWPRKPDVVFEAGNAVCSTNGKDFDIPDSLCLLSTNYQQIVKPFTVVWGTSGATAQVARIGARLWAKYPYLWPETVRALIVHSARWTPKMGAELNAAGGRKLQIENVVRRYGFGVPDEDRAAKSAKSATTLVVQGKIKPFANGKMREMKLHQLPWAKDALEQIPTAGAELRITLSYFVEPNPARRGWIKRHRYASHGLRFSVISPTEKLDAFRKRVNSEALDEDEGRPRVDDATGWLLGNRARDVGSLHCDIWRGTAADLACRNVIAVYPISGWWKDQPAWDRSEQGVRYALTVSIETEAQEVDLWTPIAIEAGVQVTL